MIDKEVNNFKQIIIQLEHRNKEKDSKIISLERVIQAQAQQLREKDMIIKSLELMSKERAKTINKKQMQIIHFEDKIIQLETNVKNTDHLHKKILQQKINKNRQQEIIREQNQQLLQLLQDHELYISNFQQFTKKNIETTQERDLLLDYKEELQNQIDQVQKINGKLIERCEQDEEEVRHQNQQGSDLLGQIQYMIEFYEGVCQC